MWKKDMASPNSLVYVILYQQTANAAMGAMPIAAFAVISTLTMPAIHPIICDAKMGRNCLFMEDNWR